MPSGSTAGIRSFFEPKSVAVAGVSEDPNKLGSIIFANLVANAEEGSLRATVYALNPAHSRIGLHACYPTIRSLPSVPELLIIAVPVALTPKLVEDAARAGVKAVVMVPSGFAEAGREELEKGIGAVARRHGMRILGPNTIGLLDTRSGVNSLFLRSTKKLPDGSEVVALLKPLKGDVAVITQSGHLGEVVAEELAAEGVGIRALVGAGNQLDVSVEEIIRYFADDPHTRVVAVYLEGVRDGRRFMRAAAYATKKKPLVVLKVGKTAAGARAALTHTASLVGDYQVYQAAFRQAGVVEAGSITELLDCCVSLSMLPRTAGRRLVIVTNAGGVGAIAADEAGKSGLDAKPLSDAEVQMMHSAFRDAGFASNASFNNPIDLTASATTGEFVRAAELALGLPDYDLALIFPSHQTPAIDADIAIRLEGVVSGARKPVCMSVMGSSELAVKIHNHFMANGIPSFPTPERAVRALSAVPTCEALRTDARAPADLVPRPFRALSRLRGPIPQRVVARLLTAYGIHEPRSVVVRSPEDFRRGEEVGFPVACKLLSRQLLHKADAGGVILGVAARSELSSAFLRFKTLAKRRGLSFDGMLVQEMVGGVEMILGGTRDATFGPTVLFGVGGSYTELFRDFSLGIAPLTRKEAAALVDRCRLSRALDGYRGGPLVDRKELARIVSSFSRIMGENPAIDQIEVNPLVATRKDILALDARVITAPRKPRRR
ncbi:MAG TPA: acetate--CoA ligase family protein [Nitrososphaerales archaeon]|nr:acetate--CoA ligase family protein [Nitrososphaerales archaeon]